jgi:hypothetical protein
VHYNSLYAKGELPTPEVVPPKVLGSRKLGRLMGLPLTVK